MRSPLRTITPHRNTELHKVRLSVDGYRFSKFYLTMRHLICDLLQLHNAVNDMHVVHDLKAKRYYQYYWHRAARPQSMSVRVGSDNKTDFEFDQPEEVIIRGSSLKDGPAGVAEARGRGASSRNSPTRSRDVPGALLIPHKVPVNGT